MDAVTTTSDVSASFVDGPSIVIHHGIDLDAYKPPADRAAAFAATGLPGKYGIGTFGRVRRQKGSDLFVEAMCRLLPKYPDFTAVIVGHVSVDNLAFVEKLKSRIAAAGLSERIRFLGERPIEEVPLWYQRISIYVFASRVEGFGLTMLEAMAAGDAVIATRAGAAETGDRRRRDRVSGADRRRRRPDGGDRADDAGAGAHRRDRGEGPRPGRTRLQPRARGGRDRRRLSAAVGRQTV